MDGTTSNKNEKKKTWDFYARKTTPTINRIVGNLSLAGKNGGLAVGRVGSNFICLGVASIKIWRQM